MRFLILCCVALFSCGQDVSKPDVDAGTTAIDSGQTFDAGPGDAGIRECNIPVLFATRCTFGCHDSSTSASANLDLLSPRLEARLYNRFSVFRHDYFIIDAEVPEESALLSKVSTTPPYGAGMPPGDPLGAEDKACLFQWIQAVSQNPPDASVLVVDAGVSDSGIRVDSGTPDASVSDAGIDAGIFYGPLVNDAGCAPGDGGFCIFQLVAEPLYAVRGSSANNVWAVGARGAAYLFNGTTWNRIDAGTTSTLFDVFVDSAGAYAVGEQGLILKYRAGVWAPMPYGPTTALDAGVNANGSTDYNLGGIYSDGTKTWAVGEGGTMVEIVGNNAIVRRSSKLSSPLGDLNKIWARNSTEWWAMGDGIYRSADGINWTVGSGATQAYFGIIGARHPTTNVPVLWSPGQRLMNFDYDRQLMTPYPWQPFYTPASDGLPKGVRAAWLDDSGKGFSVGLDGAIILCRYTNATNEPTCQRMVSPTFDHLLGIWGTNPNAVWAVGGRSSGIILKNK
jgi:hypothetical protein